MPLPPPSSKDRVARATMLISVMSMLTMSRSLKSINPGIPVLLSELDQMIEALLESKSEIGIYSCKACNRSGPYKKVIEQHIEAKHIQTPGFKCPMCGKISKTRYALSMHLYRQHKQQGKSPE